MASKGFKLALVATFGLGAFLELYYYSWCPVSNSYYQTNLMIAREIITTLNDINAAYWPDFATLLNVVRCAPPPAHHQRRRPSHTRHARIHLAHNLHFSRFIFIFIWNGAGTRRSIRGTTTSTSPCFIRVRH
jgi:hypothetical protein